MRELYTRAQSRRLEVIHMSETTKAAAWAVFQHHGGAATSYNSRGSGIAVRRATRFKIEAQMKNGAHSEGRAIATLCTTVNNQWDAGSTLFDSYELDSLSKQFDQAFLFASRNCLEPAPAKPVTSYVDESQLVERTKSPFLRQHHLEHAARVLPSERMRDFVEDSYPLEPHFQPMPPASIVEKTGYKDEPADEQNHDGKSPGTSCSMEESQEETEETTIKLGQQKVHSPLQFAHTPNPLNLSQRNSRRSMDNSHDSDGTRQSFQEKLRNFFHKARISPQDAIHKSDSNPRRGRKSYTDQDDSLFHYGWSYVEDNDHHHHHHHHSPEESDIELLSEKANHSYRLTGLIRKVRAEKTELDQFDTSTVTTLSSDCRKLSKHKRGGSFSFRSVTKALHSLPHFQGGTSESHRHRQSTVTEHEHHHVYYHHHHHHIVIHQQQLEDYELSLQDIDSPRVPRKSFEEKASSRIIPFHEDASSNFNSPTNPQVDETSREHQNCLSSDNKQQQQQQQFMVS